MPELTLPPTTTEAPLDLREWEPPRSNGHAPPSGTNGGGPGGGGRPGGGRPGGEQGDAGDMDRTDWRWVHIPLAVAAFFVLACIVANLIPLDSYVLTVGQPRSAASLITHGRSKAGADKILVNDVYVSRISAFGYLFYSVVGRAQVVPGATVLGPGIPPSELSLEEDAETAQSVADAKAAAFHWLGYRVAGRESGVLVLAVEPGSPGSRFVRQGEIVRAVDGVATNDDCAFARAMAPKAPGEVVELTVEQSRVTPKGTIVPGPSVGRRVRLGRRPRSVPPSPALSACPGRRQTRAEGYLGLIVDSEESFRFPIPLAVSADGLHGSSIGFGVALGVVDVLSGDDLTGKRTVAATGTITPGGKIGEVSEAAETAIAAWRDGATVLFVPAAQAKATRSAVGNSLRVVGVRTLAQAIADLRDLRGASGNHSGLCGWTRR